jgi:hypothetical protein
MVWAPAINIEVAELIAVGRSERPVWTDTSARLAAAPVVRCRRGKAYSGFGRAQLILALLMRTSCRILPRIVFPVLLCLLDAS